MLSSNSSSISSGSTGSGTPTWSDTDSTDGSRVSPAELQSLDPLLPLTWSDTDSNDSGAPSAHLQPLDPLLHPLSPSVESLSMPPNLWYGGRAEHADGTTSNGSNETWIDQEEAGSSTSSSASLQDSFGSATAAPQRKKRGPSARGDWLEPADHDSGAAGSSAKFQRTDGSLDSKAAATKRSRPSATSAATCFSAGAVALVFVFISAGQVANQQTSLDPDAAAPRIVPETERWQCVPEPSSVLPHWIDSELCRSDPTAMFPCTVTSSQEDSCAAGHGVLVGRICRCDGCFTGGECMAWENTVADQEEPCDKFKHASTLGAASGGGGQNKTTCQCSGTGNQIKCSNGDVRYCAAEQECTAKIWRTFDYGDWSACKDAPPAPRPQWRQQLHEASYVHRNSPAIMWLATNSSLLLYLFASGLKCPDSTAPHGVKVSQSG